MNPDHSRSRLVRLVPRRPPRDASSGLDGRVHSVADLQSVESAKGDAAGSERLEALKVAAVFERELFRIDDARLAATDTQAGILIAAAVAVATFTGGLVRNGAVN